MILTCQSFLTLSPEEQAEKLSHIHESHMSRLGSTLTKIVKELLTEDPSALQDVFDYLMANPAQGISRIKYLVMHADIDHIHQIMILIGDSPKFVCLVVDALMCEFKQMHSRRHRLYVMMKMVAILTESNKVQEDILVKSTEFFTFINYAGNFNRILFEQMDNEHFEILLSHLVNLFIHNASDADKRKDILSVLSKVLKFVPAFPFEKVQLAKTALLPLKQFIELEATNDPDHHYLELQLAIIMKPH